ncbi:MAG: NAD(P)H-hydrate dehydratase [Pseudomonadales bacterium]
MMQLKLYSAEAIRTLDRRYMLEYDISGLKLMGKAARSVLAFIDREIPNVQRAQVFCGSGNNAGDGFLIAAFLADRGWSVQVFLIGDPSKLGLDAASALKVCQGSAAQMSRVEGNEGAASVIDPNSVIIDALLGLGVSGPVRPEYQSVIAAINTSGAAVISVDLPSGLDPDTGVADAVCVRATATVTFIAHKIGLFSQDGPEVSGRVVLDDLGVPEPLMKDFAAAAVSTLVALPLSPRPKRSHKGTFGRVLVVGGNKGMGGAPLLAAEAALRSGAGLVSVVTRAEHVSGFLARRPELMVRAANDEMDLTELMAQASAIVIGPGLGQDTWALNLFHQVMACEKPLVIDADALNLVSRFGLANRSSVMTPHPLEAARLLGQAHVDADRMRVLDALVDRYPGVKVLKGHGTLVGDGHRTALNPFGNPGMATAGMGDVLSGIIGSLLAQGCNLWEAATLSVAHHAAAADAASLKQGEVGLLASDVIAGIGKSLAGIR